MGALFGAAKGVLLCVAITFFAVTLSAKARTAVLHSRSGHYIAVLLDRADAVMPKEIHEVLDPYLHKLEHELRADQPTQAGDDPRQRDPRQRPRHRGRGARPARLTPLAARSREPAKRIVCTARGREDAARLRIVAVSMSRPKSDPRTEHKKHYRTLGSGLEIGRFVTASIVARIAQVDPGSTARLDAAERRYGPRSPDESDVDQPAATRIGRPRARASSGAELVVAERLRGESRPCDEFPLPPVSFAGSPGSPAVGVRHPLQDRRPSGGTFRSAFRPAGRSGCRPARGGI